MAAHNGKAFSTKDRDNATHTIEQVQNIGNKGDDTGMRWYKVKGRTSKNN
jgi:hypothetical protein